MSGLEQVGTSVAVVDSTGIDVVPHLATIATQTRNDAQIIDVLTSILGQLKLLNANFSYQCAPGASQLDEDQLDNWPIAN